MASVVFLRGVNVGGHKAFQPTAVAHDLADLAVVNIGAAGTFVVRRLVSASRVREEFRRRLAFDADMMICPAREVLDLVAEAAFGDESPAAEMKRYVSILGKRPRSLPALPIEQPANEHWQVKVVGVSGRFVLSLHRRQGRTLIYPNEVVEKRLGVSATTRNWNTISAIRAVLADGRLR